MVPVTAFFAGILGIIYLGLAFLVIRKRYSLRLSLGDGGQDAMMRRIRAHANFAEYVPFCLILLALNEMHHAPQKLVFFLGALLVIGRLSHAYSLITAEVKSAPKIIFRQIGMVSTFAVLLVNSLMLILA